MLTTIAVASTVGRGFNGKNVFRKIRVSGTVLTTQLSQWDFYTGQL